MTREILAVEKDIKENAYGERLLDRSSRQSEQVVKGILQGSQEIEK